MISSPIKIKAATKNTCSRILTPKQVGPICWFMATFVSMFYSQRSRKILLEASKDWDIKKELFTLLKQVLDDKYLKVASRESDDYKRFSDNTFIDILKLLHQENKKTFMFNPVVNKGGFTPNFYIGRLYNLLNIDYTIIEYDVENEFLVYSLLNEEYNDDIDYKFVQKYNRLKKYYDFLYFKFTIKPKSKFKKGIQKFTRFIDNPMLLLKDERNRFEEKDKPFRPSRWFKESPKKFKDAHTIFNNTPSILIVIVSNFTCNSAIYGEGVYYKKDNNILHNKITDPYIKNSIQSMDEQIFYNGFEYNLDSVILGDIEESNLYHSNHIIAGITCKKKRYVYNGWTRTSMEPAMATTKITRDIPCELMRQDWNIEDDIDYCLNATNCQLDLLTKKDAKLCFNFSKSKGNRILIYVRKDNKRITSSSYSPQISSNISSSPSKSKSFHSIIITEENIDQMKILISKQSKIDKVILRDVKLTPDLLDMLYRLEVSAITHFIIVKTKDEYYETDNEFIFGLLYLIETMKNIKLLDFSGFQIEDSHSTMFVEIFTNILLKLKKLKYLNFTNNTIEAEAYNKIFKLGDRKSKPDTTKATMMITDDKKLRKVKFNTHNCSTPKFIDMLKEYKNPVYFYNSHPLINYKNPEVGKQIKSIVDGMDVNI